MTAAIALASCEWETRTARLHIAPAGAATAAELARIVADPAVGWPYWIGCAPHDAAARWDQCPGGWNAAAPLTLAVRTRAGATIGCVRFEGAQLSYFLARDAWRQGYGAEMIAAACRHYPRRLDIDTLHATVLRENLASRRILEKTGFAYKGLRARAIAGRPGLATMLRFELAV